MRTLICVLMLGTCSVGVQAQEKLLKLSALTRVDYQREYVGGDAVHENSGFKGQYFMLCLDGTITKDFSYSYRQRLNKAHSDQSFFDATDWARLIYTPDGHWSISAGKEVVGIGGYEYDRHPADIYMASEYWNNIACYQLGATVGYTPNGGKDKLAVQVTQSPFRYNSPDMYAYNLTWSGSHGCLGTLYSANIVEYRPGKYISYLAFGHRISLGRLRLEADFMNRASSGQAFLFKDCSIMAELSYRPIDKLNLFGKVTYDVNRTRKAADLCVVPGTELTDVGGGIEFYPHKTVRVHAAYAHSFGKNGNPDGVVLPGSDRMSVGLTWNINLLSLDNPWMRQKD